MSGLLWWYSDIVGFSKNKFPMNKNNPQPESDLKDMLGDLRPRRVGEQPRYMGDYQRIAPDIKIYQHVLRMKGRIIKPVDAKR